MPTETKKKAAKTTKASKSMKTSQAPKETVAKNKKPDSKKVVTSKTSKNAAHNSHDLENRLEELEKRLDDLVNVLHSEFRNDMLRGPRGAARSLERANLLK